MSYEKQVWKDGTTDYTPLTPERLNHMEDGIAAANDAWDSVAHAQLTTATAADRWGRIVLLAMRDRYAACRSRKRIVNHGRIEGRA